MGKVLPRHLAFCLLVLLPLESCPVLASGWGRVNMQGAVIETACAIDTENSDQTIDMSLLPLGQIIIDGQSLTRSFRILLVNCVLGNRDESQPDWWRFQVTFDGRVDNGFFGVDGQARGIALQLTDNRGNTAIPGEPLPAMSIIEGGSQLHYSLRLVSNLQVLRVGEYTATIRFKMNYY